MTRSERVSSTTAARTSHAELVAKEGGEYAELSKLAGMHGGGGDGGGAGGGGGGDDAGVRAAGALSASAGVAARGLRAIPPK